VVRPATGFERFRRSTYFRLSIVRATVRWLKHMVSFEGWLEYIVQKRAGTAEPLQLTERERRFPLLFLGARLPTPVLGPQGREEGRVTPSLLVLRSCSARRSPRCRSSRCCGAAPDLDAVKKGSSFLLGIGNFPRALADVGDRAGRARAARGRLRPDAMNAGGLLFGMLSGILIGLGSSRPAAGRSRSRASATSSTAPRARRGVASSYGKFVDSTLDRFVETFAFLGFAVYFARWPYGPLVVAAGSASRCS
jgi:hypothetical protein